LNRWCLCGLIFPTPRVHTAIALHIIPVRFPRPALTHMVQ
jgi:hypothetical protein